MKMTIAIQASTPAHLTEQEIIEIVGRDEFERRKKELPGGLFKGFVLCHEGEASPNILGKGRQKVSWPRSAVQSAYNTIRNGLKFFNKHNTDNSTTGREPYGEIVGKTQKMIDDRLSTVVVGWFDKAHKPAADKSDIVSMEAVWDMIDTGTEIVAKGIDRITGIALGQSSEALPAFDGAVGLASVQAYGGITVDEPQVATKPKLSFHEAKDLIRQMVVHPTQLYETNEIIGKRVEGKNGVEWIGGDRDLNHYIENVILKEARQEIADLRDQLGQVNTKLTDYEKRSARMEAGPRVIEALKKKEAPQRAITWAENNLDRMEFGDDIDASIEKFTEHVLAEDKRLVEMGYGVAEPAPSPALGSTETEEGDGNWFTPKKK